MYSYMPSYLQACVYELIFCEINFVIVFCCPSIKAVCLIKLPVYYIALAESRVLVNFAKNKLPIKC